MLNTKKDVLFAAKKLKSQLVYNMAKAEGNTHTVAEVATIIEGFTVGGKKLQEQQQVVQIAAAWDYLIELVDSGRFIFSKQLAFELNKLVASADFSEVGCFRNRNVLITGTEYIPPMFTRIPSLWDELEQTTKNQSDPKVAAFNVFLGIARNQFFNDGNKRTGQLMMNGILMSNCFHIVTFPDRVIPEFFNKIIEFYDTGDKSSMIELLDQRQKEMEKAFSKDPDPLI